MKTTTVSNALPHMFKRFLPWHHWFVVILSLLLTLGAWLIASQQVEKRNKAQFDYQAAQLLELVQERMVRYEEALWGGVAALHMLPHDATREDWRLFAESLQIETRFPGINGIGVIHYVPAQAFETYLTWQRESLPDYQVYPAHNETDYWPITYIEPQQLNRQAVGLDMAHEENRYQAAQRARDTGTASITGPITLVQDDMRTPGFLFYAPWYSQRLEQPTLAQRRSEFRGLVYAPFIMHKLMDGVLENVNRQVHFSIHDAQQSLYSELSEASVDYDANPMFSASFSVPFYGRTWDFQVQTTALFRQQNTHHQPLLILLGGIVIDLLLIIIFVLLNRANRIAVAYANEVTQDLRLRQQELEEANRELDQFAFVASHDLKAPLRGIQRLADWIEEDLHGKLETQTADYLKLLQSRVARLENLLDDLLIYSRVGRKEGVVECFSFTKRIEEIFALLDPPKGFKLECHDVIGEVKVFTTPFELVFRNLIANAIKHHDRAQGVITVYGVRDEKGYRFEVADDGPGIPAEHRDRVFELFHTLKPRDEVEGSGLGLAIIKKILDQYECEYRLQANGERGVRFIFHWPQQE